MLQSHSVKSSGQAFLKKNVLLVIEIVMGASNGSQGAESLWSDRAKHSQMVLVNAPVQLTMFTSVQAGDSRVTIITRGCTQF